MTSTCTRSGMQRIAAGSVTPSLRATLYDQDGAVATADVTATCTITRADGTVVATARAVSDTSGVLTCALTTAEAITLDVLRAEWTVSGVVRATTWHRVVGRHLFSLAELDDLGGLGEFSAAQKMRARDAVTDIIESATHAAWCPSYDIDARRAAGRTCMVATARRPLRSVRAATLDGVALDLTNIRVDAAAGVIDLRWYACGQLEVGYEHGFDAPTDALREAALWATKDRLLRRKGALSDRTRAITDDFGTRQFSFAGPGHPFGVDEIDAVVMAHDQGEPEIG